MREMCPVRWRPAGQEVFSSVQLATGRCWRSPQLEQTCTSYGFLNGVLFNEFTVKGVGKGRTSSLTRWASRTYRRYWSSRFQGASSSNSRFFFFSFWLFIPCSSKHFTCGAKSPKDNNLRNWPTSTQRTLT